jgi:hypothetical protein
MKPGLNSGTQTGLSVDRRIAYEKRRNRDTLGFGFYDALYHCVYHVLPKTVTKKQRSW